MTCALAVAALAVAAIAGCASGVETKDDGGGGETTSVSSAGGASGGAGSGGQDLPCGVDCGAIETPDCTVAVCNMQTLQCEVVPADAGTACDDGVFCTVNDGCDGAGQCAGGPPNECGLVPGDCDEVSCDETAKTCTLVPKANGSPCTNTQDLCLVNTTCSNGACTGMAKDCFFAPVPNDCHISVCNPTNGMCEPVPGNEGQACVDINDLCTIDKTCSGGQCVGGTAKDCTSLTMGCFDGVCDTTTGQCVQQPIMPGQQCAEGTDQCNVGICDVNGMCNPTPANEGQSCNDTNACTAGDVCSSGTCAGTAVTQCVGGDSCCPPSCTISNDSDCTTSCLGILQSSPMATDGPYQIVENSVMVDVYCDMTHGGVTYRHLGFGNHLGSYPGYTMVSVADLQDPVIQQAFVFLYNLQGSALDNLDTTFTTGNCCIKLAEHVAQNSFLSVGGSYVYPADLSNASDCNTNYPASQYRFYLPLLTQASPNPMPTNYFQTNPAATSTACSNSNNPAWFWRKF